MSFFSIFFRWLTLASLLSAFTGPVIPNGPATPPNEPNRSFFPHVGAQESFPFTVPNEPYRSFVPHLSAQDTITSLGPVGGEVTALVINPLNTQIIYAGTFGGGVYKSVDGGKTWQDSSGGLIDLYIQSMAIDPQNPETVYAGMYRFGVYKSTDGGLSWAPTGPGLNEAPIVYDLQVDPQNPQILYAGTRGWTPVFTWQPPWGGGVFKSVNGGDTWTKQNNGLTEDWVYSLAIDPIHPQIVYAASHSQGVFKSTDGAATWTAMSKGIGDLAGRAIVVNPQNPQIVYYGTWHGGGVFRTTNGGTSWGQVSSGLSGAKIYKLLIDPAAPSTLYAASYLTGLFKSTNSGSGWGLAALGSDFIAAMAVDPADHSRVLAGTAGAGIYSSSDTGNTWASINQGLYASLIESLAQNSSYLFAGLANGGLYRSKDRGATWTVAGELDHQAVNSITINPANSSVIYATTSVAGVYKSTDGGLTWQTKNSGLAAASLAPASVSVNSPTGPFDLFQEVRQEDEVTGLAPQAISYSILTLAFDTSNPANVFIGTNTSGVLMSTNSGGSWGASGLAGLAVYSLAVDPSAPQVIYAGTDGSSGALWKSTNGGSSWSQSSSGLQNITVNFVLVDPAQTSHVLAGTSDGVYQSTNSGGSWARIGFAGVPVYSLTFTGQGLFAAAGSGLFISRDGGAHWLDFTGIEPVFQVNCLLPAQDSGKVLFAGTNGRGMVVFPGY
jgi:photosystem II stability/assembly factor-like uncharacterized protein